MNLLSIIIGKILIKIGKLLNRGSSLPGQISLRIDKNILSKMKMPNKIIAVTGSSGKGSTSTIIAELFRDSGYSVAHNISGSNLIAGITTTLLENCTLTGKIKSDVLIFEIDERYTKYVFKSVKPDTLVITNICRDQPPRQGHFDLVFEEINKSIDEDVLLVLNGDDPYLRKFETNKKNKVIYYGIDKNKYSYEKNQFMNLNLNYCPICNSKLEYNYYNFENNGDYYCKLCSFKRPIIDYRVTNINYNKNEIKINDTYKIKVPYNVLFCIYNTLAAFTIADIYQLDINKVISSLSSIEKNKKIYNVYDYEDRIVTVLNNKNENSSTFNQSLLYIDRFKELKTIIIGWKEISRRYNFDDLSWLYDIDFEMLKKSNLDKIVCAGKHRYDIATRLKLAGIEEKKIIVYETLLESTNYIKAKTKGNIYAILNFDYVSPFNEYMNGSDTNDN